MKIYHVVIYSLDQESNVYDHYFSSYRKEKVSAKIS
ncbi:hypothetical protein LCGC14_0885320 [marine sediment metagenome]|uniref:Uncharacterized protein n=1 Tax=marine sediment metagenome TaxID=412755 RepID=A0A0F9PLC8_9ZZZZ